MGDALASDLVVLDEVEVDVWQLWRSSGEAVT